MFELSSSYLVKVDIQFKDVFQIHFISFYPSTPLHPPRADRVRILGIKRGAREGAGGEGGGNVKNLVIHKNYNVFYMPCISGSLTRVFAFKLRPRTYIIVGGIQQGALTIPSFINFTRKKTLYSQKFLFRSKILFRFKGSLGKCCGVSKPMRINFHTISGFLPKGFNITHRRRFRLSKAYAPFTSCWHAPPLVI